MDRPTWDQYFMGLATHAATRGTCCRKRVGAVVVLNGTVVSTGYNGSIRGQGHCTEIGCLMENGHCIRTVHAEANAIVQAARHGAKVDGAHIYTTASPCFGCMKLIANAGLTKVFYAEKYGGANENVDAAAMEAGIQLIQVSASGPVG